MVEFTVSGRRYRLGGPMTSIVKRLIIINVVIFVAERILSRFTGINLWMVFGLVPAYVFGRGMVWQLITHMFLHGSVGHIVLNMLWLWMFGGDIEQEWGRKQFLSYYLLTGLGAGILSFLAAFGSTVPGIGASGAIFGLLVAYGLMFPNRTILVFFFPMKVKHFVLLAAAIELWACWGFTCSGGGHFAHLGGALTGYIYLKAVWKAERSRSPEQLTTSRFSKLEYRDKRRR